MLKSIFSFLFGLLVFVVVLEPLIIVNWPEIVTYCTFFHWVSYPGKNLSIPANHIPLLQSKNLRIDVKSSGETTGAWLINRTRDSEGDVTILFLHGITLDRGSSYRCKVYYYFASAGYNILTIDYRGYGDSVGHPTEAGVIEDSAAAYHLLQSTTKERIVIFGQSLGTAMATGLAAHLCRTGSCPSHVILDSPFDDILAVALDLPIFWLLSHSPNFVDRCVTALDKVNLRLNNTANLLHAPDTSVLILHAEDDGLVPARLSRDLERAVASPRITRVEYPASLSLGHQGMYQAPSVFHTIKRFIST